MNLRGLLLALLLVAGCAPPQTAGPGGETVPAPDLITDVNTARSAQGLAALATEPGLTAAAMAHGADMAAKGYFAHQAPDGSTPLRRMRAAGVNACYAAENIARGQKDTVEVVQSWMASAEHRRLMLSPNPRSTAQSLRSPGLRPPRPLQRPGHRPS